MKSCAFSCYCVMRGAVTVAAASSNVAIHRHSRGGPRVLKSWGPKFGIFRVMLGGGGHGHPGIFDF